MSLTIVCKIELRHQESEEWEENVCGKERNSLNKHLNRKGRGVLKQGVHSHGSL